MSSMDQRSSNSGSGFLLGVLVGVAITLLFTTKKGRKILKALTDEGWDKISNLEDLFEKRMREEDEDDMGFADYDAKASMALASQPQPHTHAMHHEEVAPMPPPHQSPFVPEESLPSHFHHTASPGRRFFRGIPKRSN